MAFGSVAPDPDHVSITLIRAFALPPAPEPPTSIQHRRLALFPHFERLGPGWVAYPGGVCWGWRPCGARVLVVDGWRARGVAVDAERPRRANTMSLYACNSAHPAVMSGQHVCEALRGPARPQAVRLPAAGRGLPGRAGQGPPPGAAHPWPRGPAQGVGPTRPARGRLHPAGPAPGRHPPGGRPAAAGRPLP